MPRPLIAVVGGGPAGLMAAESAIMADGAQVHVFDAMPSMGRKFLMAGKSGLNLTHTEPAGMFLSRFGAAGHWLEPILNRFGSEDVRSWAHGLGIETFVGSSSQVFPVDFKAAPILRAWLRRLRAAGVVFHVRHRWIGWDEDGASLFDTPNGQIRLKTDSLILAMGGASWPNLGSDGAWVPVLGAQGVQVTPLKPANCGFDVGWSAHFRARFAGEAVKPVALSSDAGRIRGEFIITEQGIEGSGVYPHSATLRDAIAANGNAILTLDLLPDHPPNRVAEALNQPRGSRSLAEHLRRTLGLKGVKAGLLRECLPPDALSNTVSLTHGIKSLPLTLSAPRPIAEAISSAGGIAWSDLSENLMIRGLPGVFAAGEMLDWEVRTGGYLLTACLALGHTAGTGAADWLNRAR